MFDWLKRFRRLPSALSVPHNRTPAPQLSPRSNAYTESPWVYVAVNRIAEAAALVPLHVYRTTDGRDEPLVAHPLARLLQRPNPLTSRFELLEQTVGLLELTGNAYWFLAGDGEGPPNEIWPLRPDRVSVVPDDEQGVRGYVYTVNGRPVPLNAEEVIHFKRWHPQNDHYGLSPLVAAGLAVQTDRAMAAWNRNTYTTDHAIPAGILSVNTAIGNNEFARLQQEWRAIYGGTQQRTAIVRGGELSWQSVSHKHTDLEFLRGRAANRDEILTAFGLPIALVSENATEANAKVAERTFIERTLYPKLVRLSGKLSAELAPFFGEDVHIAFDDIRPTDQQARIEDIRAAYPVLSVNEIRARFYGLPPVAWGDVPAVTSGELVAV